MKENKQLKEDLMSQNVSVPMEGKVIKINVNVGDQVNAEDEVIIMEAMKMEMPVTAPAAGTVKEIKVAVGQTFAADAVLMVLE
jgi:acetyl-CoA carboxylase biotin carboxyl carrier protein